MTPLASLMLQCLPTLSDRKNAITQSREMVEEAREVSR